MQNFSPDEARRWDTWQAANAVSARRSDRLSRLSGVVLFSAVTIALAVALWMR